MTRHATTLVAVTVLILAGPPLAAQQGPGRGRMELERRIQARFGELVREQLGLTADQQQRLGDILRDLQERRRDITRRQAILRMSLRSRGRLAPRDTTPLLSEADARAVLEEMRSIQEAETRLFMEEQQRLLSVLTPAQLVRFYAMRERLAERVRGLRGGRGPRGPPGLGKGSDVLPPAPRPGSRRR